MYALQLLSVLSSASNQAFSPSYFLAVDFSVYRSINVTAVGAIDCDSPGLSANLSVRVLNRTKDSDRVIWLDSFTANEMRKDTTNPFVFRATSFVLLPGLYTLATTTTSAVGNRFYDEAVESAAARGRRADTPYVVATSSVWGPADRVDEVFSAAGVEANGALYIAATLVFDILDNGAPAALPANVYDDCESVACALTQAT